jgi:type III pantothenate kinase
MTDLLIDIGNTRLKWRTQEQGQVTAAGAIATQELCLQLLEAQLPKVVTQMAWASVAAGQHGGVIEQWAKTQNLIGYEAQSQSQWQDLTNGYEQAQQMGVDRWLAMVAARQRIKSAVCVVDCGSAITLDYINATGEHEGGYIMPGQGLMAQALLRHTAHIQYSGQALENTLPGRHTGQAVSAGCGQMSRYGLRGLVLAAQQQGYSIVFCGGDGAAPAKDLGLTYIGDLVLDGLALVAGFKKV